MKTPFIAVVLTSLLTISLPAAAEDAAGCEDHGALTRYPGSELQWCKTDNFLPYRIPDTGWARYGLPYYWQMDRHGRQSHAQFLFAGRG